MTTLRARVPLLDRELVRAILLPTIVACILFTAVFALFHLSRIAEVVADVLPSLSDFLELLATMVPQFLALTFPLAFVFGVFVAYGDLRSSGEYVALRAVGVSLGRAMRPAVVLGVTAFAVGLGLSHGAEPAGKRLLKNFIRRVAVDVVPTQIAIRVFQSFARGVLFYAGAKGPDGELRDVVLIDQRRIEESRAIFASRAKVTRSDGPRPAQNGFAAPGSQDVATGSSGTGVAAGAAYSGMRVALWDGVIEEFPPIASEAPLRRATFRWLEVPLDLQGDLERRTRFLREFEEWSTPELLARTAALRAKGENVSALEVGFHRRFAIPFATIVFVLIGVPLALAGRGGNGKRATSVALSVVLVGFYYLLLRTSDGFAATVPPWLAAWAPNLVMAVMGTAIYRWAARQ